MEPIFFKTPADFREWLEENHDQATELVVGYYKKDSGKPSMTWPESVDQALCFGWIDGIRRSINGESYSIRFTPRKPTSNWSAINISRVAELTKDGLMHPAGLKAFEARKEEKSGIYSYEQRDKAKLETAEEKHFKANQKAWDGFHALPPSYQKTAIWWVVSAKQAKTRQKRLETLIQDSAEGKRIAQLRPRPGKK
jgi:uncharacterized protein YdeI (YjbR/CyaY-like superfamily)